MSEKKVIDVNTINSLREIMGDAFDLLITTFINDTGTLIHSLPELQKQNNIEVFMRNAHSIKSSSANLGALKISLLAAELEGLGKNGNISDTSSLIEYLTLEFNIACSELTALR